MRYVSAYMLAVLGGAAQPTKEQVKQIIASVGVDVDEEKLAIVMSQLEGKDVEALLAEGKYCSLFFC